MPFKKEQYTYSKISQDIDPNKVPQNIYFDAKNIRVVTSGEESTGAVTNQKGNVRQAELADILTNPSTKVITGGFPIVDMVVVGYCNLNDSYVLFATNNTVDAIYVMDKDFNITLNFIDNLDFSTNNPIQAIGIYENRLVQKVYWVDGVNEVRYLNVAQDNINLDNKLLSLVPDTIMVEPKVIGISSGGSYTSGVVRYSYNQYSLNGAQTKISPLSQTYYLNDGDNGNNLRDLVSKTLQVQVDGIDPTFDYIKIYSIKYDSLNSVPKVSVIYDEALSGTTVTTLDDGNSIIEEISLSEFIFLGGDLIVPKHLVTKDNYLFFLNYTQPSFDVDYDARAYRFNVGGNSLLQDANGNITINSATDTVAPTHDCINPSNTADKDELNFKTYIFQADGITSGGEGPNVSYSISYNAIQSNFTSDSLVASDATNLAANSQPFKLKTYKRGEIYRFGIEFIDAKGRKSFVKWIGDIKIPDHIDNNPIQDNGMLSYVYINFVVNNLPVSTQGWRIMRVQRTDFDKTILSQGPLTSTMTNQTDPAFDNMPGYFFRNKRNLDLLPTINAASHGTTLNAPTVDVDYYDRPIKLEHNQRLGVTSTNAGDDLNLQLEIDSDEPKVALTADLTYLVDSNLVSMYTPEFLRSPQEFSSGDKLRIIGLAKAENATSYRNFFKENGSEADRGSEYDTQPNGVLILNPRDGDSDDSRKQGRYIGETANPNWNSRINAYTRRFGGLTYLSDGTVTDIDSKPLSVGPNQGIVIYSSDNSDTRRFRQDTIVQVGGDTGNFKALHATSALLKLLPTINLEDITPALSGGDNEAEYATIGELIRKVPNQYGGNTYESRQRNNYIPVSEYATGNSADAFNGDTFIQKLNLLRSFKLENTTIYTSEVLSVPVETSVNLDLRYDLAASRLQNTDANEETYYGFNDVYQQENNLIKGVTKPSTFIEIEDFSSRVTASKIKILGENIDSFTDISVNDYLDLDTQYGELTGVINYNDEVFVFQRNAVAFLSINPRAVISSEDGTPTELGSGRLLDRFRYLTTKSGSVNKWSIIDTDSGIFYVDVLNRTVNFLQQSDVPVSTIYGLYSKMQGFMTSKETELLVDNPYNSTGIVASYDHNTKDIYITFKTAADSFTVAYNGIVQGFTSFYDFMPNFYMYNNGDLISSVDGRAFYQHNIGVRGSFYDVLYPSYIERVLNPEATDTKLFTNLTFVSEVTDLTGDLPETINQIQLKNEYQDSSLVNANFSRRERIWRTALPREENSRNRIRGNWAKLKLQFDNIDDKKLILHDIILSYINP